MKIVEAPYQSPVVRYDPLAQITIVERRDPKTGDVSSQIPGRDVVRRLETSRPSSTSEAGASGQFISLIV